MRGGLIVRGLQKSDNQRGVKSRSHKRKLKVKKKERRAAEREKRVGRLSLSSEAAYSLFSHERERYIEND